MAREYETTVVVTLDDFYDEDLIKEVKNRGLFNSKMPVIENIIQEKIHELYIEYCRRGNDMNKLLEFLENNTP